MKLLVANVCCKIIWFLPLFRTTIGRWTRTNREERFERSTEIEWPQDRKSSLLHMKLDSRMIGVGGCRHICAVLVMYSNGLWLRYRIGIKINCVISLSSRYWNSIFSHSRCFQPVALYYQNGHRPRRDLLWLMSMVCGH